MFVVDKNIVRGVVGSLGLVLFYGFSFWRIFKSNPGNKVIECGSITLIVFVVMLALFKVPNFPVWVLAWLGLLVFLLCLLTIFFLVQQGYHALRRRKTG
jgi:cation transport ATPase